MTPNPQQISRPPQLIQTSIGVLVGRWTRQESIDLAKSVNGHSIREEVTKTIRDRGCIAVNDVLDAMALDFRYRLISNGFSIFKF